MVDLGLEEEEEVKAERNRGRLGFLKNEERGLRVPLRGVKDKEVENEKKR